MIYQSGHDKSNINQDMDQAIRYFGKSCDLRYKNGCLNLSVVYLTGKNGVVPDKAKALDLSTKACDLGHPWACANLSRMYMLGDGVTQDPAKAAKYKDLAKQLHSNSNHQW